MQLLLCIYSGDLFDLGVLWNKSVHIYNVCVCLFKKTNKQKLIPPAYSNDCVRWKEEFCS